MRFARAGKVVRRLAHWGWGSGHHRESDDALVATIRELHVRLDEVKERLGEAQDEIEGKLGVLDATLTQVVAGIELGTVPARETTYLGHPFVYPYDSAIGQIIGDGGEWDALLRTVVSLLLPMEEPVVWEVGSNIGASLRQILVVKPAARVVAFEPSGRFRPFLERNVELAGLGQVEVLPLFLGRDPGQAKWLYGSGTTAGVVQDSNNALHGIAYAGHEPRGRERVHITTLDDVQSEHRPVDFLKVDTDGFDLEVLRGGAALLKRDQPMLFFELTPDLAELVPSPLAERLAWLASVGYGRLACFNPYGQLVGETDDPAQAIAWAKENVYCDVLTYFQGSASQARLAGMEFATRARA